MPEELNYQEYIDAHNFYDEMQYLYRAGPMQWVVGNEVRCRDPLARTPVSEYIAKGIMSRYLSASKIPLLSIHYAMLHNMERSIFFGLKQDNLQNLVVDILGDTNREFRLSCRARSVGNQDGEVVLDKYFHFDYTVPINHNDRNLLFEPYGDLFPTSYRETLSKLTLPMSKIYDICCNTYLPDGRTSVFIDNNLKNELDQFYNRSKLGVPGNLTSSAPRYHTYYCDAVRKLVEKHDHLTMVPICELRRLERNRKGSKVCAKCKKIGIAIRKGLKIEDDYDLRVQCSRFA